MEEYYEEFEALLNLLQLSEEYALSILVSNLKPEVSKSVRLFHPKDLTHALNLAKQMEAILHNPPKKPFIPYTKPVINTNFPYSPPATVKNHSIPDPKPLPGLLPTPKNPFISQYNQVKPYNPTNSKTQYAKPVTTSNQLPRNPTREERDDRRKRGLCMWCGVKFVPGHMILTI